MKEKFIAMFNKFNMIGFVFLSLSVLLTIVATIVYGCVDYTHPAVYVFTNLSLLLALAIFVLCFFDVLGKWKNLMVVGVPILMIIALLVSIFGRLDVIGYWIDAKTPAESLQTFIVSIALLAVCVITSVAVAVNGIVKRNKKIMDDSVAES